MSISIQTNVTSLMAQENLSVNQLFESRTIQRLTSGFRINSSGDDAAGLAVANQYRADIAELTQGVQNASNGLTQLQIVDGGLNNISQMLDRMKTLAAESASGTFTGDRTTLNTEYQKLIGEITRQASNINLNAYIGGGRTSNLANSTQINVDLSGSSNAVDAVSLGLSATSVNGGGTSFAGNSVTNLSDPNARFLKGTPGTDQETFALTYLDNTGAVQSHTFTVDSTASGVSGSSYVSALNTQIANFGITGVSAQIGGDGSLQFLGGNMLQVVYGQNGAPTSPITDGTALLNSGNYQTAAGAFVAFTGNETQAITVTTGGKDYVVNLAAGNAATIGAAATAFNAALAGSGVHAVQTDATHIALEGANSFTMATAAHVGTGAGSVFSAAAGNVAVTAATLSATATGNALNAITSIDAAVGALGLVQGKVGTGENTLQYAIQLAQSQISSFSGAQSSIRDADVAAEAANLSKAQVLAQASVAALVQANAMPQAVLALLKG